MLMICRCTIHSGEPRYSTGSASAQPSRHSKNCSRKKDINTRIFDAPRPRSTANSILRLLMTSQEMMKPSSITTAKSTGNRICPKLM